MSQYQLKEIGFNHETNIGTFCSSRKPRDSRQALSRLLLLYSTGEEDMNIPSRPPTDQEWSDLQNLSIKYLSEKRMEDWIKFVNAYNELSTDQ